MSMNTNRVAIAQPLLTVALCLFCVCGAPLTWAEDPNAIKALKRENTDLRRRVEKLESALQQIQSKPKAQPGRESSDEIVDRAVDRVVAHLKAEEEKEKPPVRSRFPIDLYGYIKLDASYDTARTSVGNYARWVESEELTTHDDQFNMTARQSRFGLNFHGPESESMKVGGKVEVDFYGGGAENKNLPMMRHGYLEVNWPGCDLSLLAGQTSDLVSPLLPPTLNYTVLWWAGNYGYRRPQIRLTKGIDLGDSTLLLQTALARPIGHTPFLTGPGDTGTDSGFPHLQARAAYSFPLLTKKPTTLGISGHWGKEEWDEPDPWDPSTRNNGRNYDTWSICADATVPLHEKIALKGEVWTGEIMQAYLGGIAQGVNVPCRRPIASTGGWGNVAFGPFDKWNFNVGAGIDDPKDYDLNLHDRVSNQTVFGNVLYDVNQALRVGFELSHWDTTYRYTEDGESWRFQTSLVYRF